MKTMNTTNKDYFTFNLHNSALVVGQTGSGKTELVRSYIRRLEKAFTPDKMKYVIFDLKQVEFSTTFPDGSRNDDGAKTEYLLVPVMHGIDNDMDYLEELAKLSEKRSSENSPSPFIFIYIEECDMAYLYKDRFFTAVKTINRNAAKANMKLIFSTSRPARDDVVPEDFIQSFDLVLAGKLASIVDEVTVGMPGATRLSDHSFMVREIAKE